MVQLPAIQRPPSMLTGPESPSGPPVPPQHHQRPQLLRHPQHPTPEGIGDTGAGTQPTPAQRALAAVAGGSREEGRGISCRVAAPRHRNEARPREKEGRKGRAAAQGEALEIPVRRSDHSKDLRHVKCIWAHLQSISTRFG
jgi:hypothetical protein